MKRFMYLSILIVLLLPFRLAMAEYDVFLHNKLGDNRAVKGFGASITTNTGNSIGFLGELASPLKPNKLKRLSQDETSEELLVLYYATLKYHCYPDPNSFDCWDYEVDGLSYPTVGLGCSLGNNHAINTADKVVQGGPTGNLTYKTKQVRIILNDDFTISYRVLRINEEFGYRIVTLKNMTVENDSVGSRCSLWF